VGKIESSETEVDDQASVDGLLHFVTVAGLIPVGHNPVDAFPDAQGTFQPRGVRKLNVREAQDLTSQ
jgi:hypothetical protein